MDLFRLREQNPHWENPKEIGKDFHIQAISALPFEIISSFAVKDIRNAGFDVLWIPEVGKDPGDDAIMQKAFECY